MSDQVVEELAAAVEAEAATVTARQMADKVVAALGAARPSFSALASDTPFLDLIADLIGQLVPVLIGCFGGAAGAARELKNPRLLTRVRLRMTVRDRLDDRRAFALLGEPIVDALLGVGKTVTPADLAALSA